MALLQRGINHVKSGNFDQASKELRIAAFGLVDSISLFETAQIYATIASEKLGRETDARHAAQRVLAAERIDARYAKLDIPTDVRNSFESIVTRILTSDQVAVLHAGAGSATVTPAPIKPTPPAPINPQPPAPIVAQPVTPIVVPTPAPTPKSPAPITTKSPAPISPIELPSPAPRSEVSPPTVPPRTVQPTPAPTPAPAPKTPAPVVIAPIPVPPPTPAPVPTFANAEAALSRNDLLTARTIYRSLLDASSVDHATALRIAEGSYRSRDFSTAIRAFDRAGALRKGEEPYRYYLAVALYESGKYSAAKRELAAALPFIEITRDVARYRAKIDGAIE